MDKRGVLVCPKCGSRRIRQADSISGFITPPRYFCQNCYYSGYFIVEIGEEDEEEDNFEEFTTKRKEKGKGIWE
nr:hypothetical protein [Candidatus Freyarchaeota archaeon]